MDSSSRSYGWASHALIAALVVVTASFIGTRATIPNIPIWYAGLQKPPFTPPNWLFGPVWTLIYAALALSFYRILRKDPGAPGRSRAIIAFMVQITLNALWSVSFFGLHSPALGLVVIALLWLSIVANMIAFWTLDHIAAWPFAPYLAWVTFAGALNVAIVMLN